MRLDLGMEADRFLSEYWQKKPCLIRNGLKDFVFDLEADDLAGLATEPQVESRLIWAERNGQPWQPEYGPFSEETLNSLPDSGWTLLIQGLDHWHRPLARLLDLFRFIPNWRLDDIMASVSPDGASVGPHFDYYDVFLIQVQGAKHWHVGPPCTPETPRLQGTPLRILEAMQVDQSWHLAPGDILYLPSGFAHHGVAEGLSITLSVGFRSPTLQEIASAWLDQLELDALPPRHIDDGLRCQPDNPGHLSAAVVSKAHKAITQELLTPSRLTRTLLRLTTEPRTDDIVIPADNPVTAEQILAFPDNGTWYWNEGSRFVYSVQDTSLTLAVDGELFDLPDSLRDLVNVLCQSSQPDLTGTLAAMTETQRQAASALLARLINRGSLVWEQL